MCVTGPISHKRRSTFWIAWFIKAPPPSRAHPPRRGGERGGAPGDRTDGPPRGAAGAPAGGLDENPGNHPQAGRRKPSEDPPPKGRGGGAARGAFSPPLNGGPRPPQVLQAAQQ